jgi:hypothetical protein
MSLPVPNTKSIGSTGHVSDHNLLTAALAEAQTNVAAATSAIAAETTARQSADTTLTTNLAAEVTRATAAETALGLRTTALEAVNITSYPGAATTGYGSTSLTAIAAGSLNIVNNATISGYNITGEVVIPASVTGVVISNCKITGSVNYGVRVNSGSSVTIQDCEIAPATNTTGAVAIGATTASTGAVTVLRCNIYGYEDGIKPGSGWTIQDSYIHDLGNNTVAIQSITNTTGNTWRYTVNPTVYGEAMPFVISNTVAIAGTTNAANSFTTSPAITAVGSNWFEITNASGVAQASAAGTASSSHCDGIQVQNGVSNLLINHNTILSPAIATGVSSAIFVSPDLGPAGAGPLTIMNNYLSGGGYYTLVIVDGNNGQYHSSGLSVINNVFVKNALTAATRVTEPSYYWNAYYGNVYTDKTPATPGVLTGLLQTAISGYLAPAFNASFTPNWRDGRTINFGALTANTTINVPATGSGTSTVPTGTQMTILFTQDATGGRTLTWNAIFLRSSNLASSGTAGQRASITFVYDGTNWVETAVSPWH